MLLTYSGSRTGHADYRPSATGGGCSGSCRARYSVGAGQAVGHTAGVERTGICLDQRFRCSLEASWLSRRRGRHGHSGYLGMVDLLPSQGLFRVRAALSILARRQEKCVPGHRLQSTAPTACFNRCKASRCVCPRVRYSRKIALKRQFPRPWWVAGDRPGRPPPRQWCHGRRVNSSAVPQGFIGILAVCVRHPLLFSVGLW